MRTDQEILGLILEKASSGRFVFEVSPKAANTESGGLNQNANKSTKVAAGVPVGFASGFASVDSFGVACEAVSVVVLMESLA